MVKGINIEELRKLEMKCMETDKLLGARHGEVREMFIRVYKKKDITGEVCNTEEVCKQLLKYAQKKKTSTIFIRNIDVLVRSVGCHNCTIDVIQELRRKGVYLMFAEDDMGTINTDFDMQIGAKITDVSRDFQNEIFDLIEEC